MVTSTQLKLVIYPHTLNNIISVHIEEQLQKMTPQDIANYCILLPKDKLRTLNYTPPDKISYLAISLQWHFSVKLATPPRTGKIVPSGQIPSLKCPVSVKLHIPPGQVAITP